MYIRKVTQKNKDTGAEYFTYRLVKTYRNADGKVRQCLLLNLGAHFELPPEQWKLLSDRIEEIISGQQVLILPDDEIEDMAQSIAKRVVHKSAEEPKVSTIKAAPDGDYYVVDVNSLEHQQVRQIGTEHVCYETVKQLGLDRLLFESGLNHKQVNAAIGSIIGRLASPGSERGTHKYLQTQSGLDELLGCDFQQMKLDSLYCIADKILCNKKVLEDKLFEKEKDIFKFEEVITLYDLTNTYFEGTCSGNAKAAYGRSKEKRSDCPLVTLALVLDASGFPKKSEIYTGNVSETKTLSQMIYRLEGKVKPTVVLDAGIASEENLEWLKVNGYTYIVVSKKNKTLIPEDASYILQHKKDYLIKAKLIKNTETKESELYCYSELKEKKEQGMRNQACLRYEAGLEKIVASLQKKGTTKSYEKILERLGRLKEKYKYVGHTYEVDVITNETRKRAVDIKWSRAETKQKAAGMYCLRSNCDDLNEQTLWDIYIMLTELEGAFRCLKSELGLRPVYHQITKRVDSHIFISVIAYHILHTIRYRLKQYGINSSWETIRRDLRTHCRITSTFTCKDGKKLHIRKSSLPNPRQLEIYKALGITTQAGKTEKSIF
jgi:transposase